MLDWGVTIRPEPTRWLPGEGRTRVACCAKDATQAMDSRLQIAKKVRFTRSSLSLRTEPVTVRADLTVPNAGTGRGVAIGAVKGHGVEA